MFDDVTLVAEDGRAVAAFTADEALRGALADALSWHVQRRFQTGALEADKVLQLRQAGALADNLDRFRGEEGRAPVRVNADQVRMIIEASSAYRSERDVDEYQPPEERDRLAVLAALIDPLFDLLADLDRADEVLNAQAYGR
jgi:hypothetical protein